MFRELDASVVVINDKPDGKNINLNCGSLHLSQLISLVKERELDLGVAFDGDADRSLFVTPAEESLMETLFFSSWHSIFTAASS